MRKIMIVTIASLLSKELYAMNRQYIGLQGGSISYEKNDLRTAGSTDDNYTNTRNTTIDLQLSYGYHLGSRIALQLDFGLDMTYKRDFTGDDTPASVDRTFGALSIGPNLVFNFRPGKSVNPFLTLGGGFIKNIGFNAAESGYTVQKETTSSDINIFYLRNAYSIFAQLGLSLEIPMNYFRASNVSWKPGVFAVYTRALGDNLKSSYVETATPVSTTETYKTVHGLTLKVFLLAFSVGF